LSLDRVKKHIQIDPNGCWLWVGALNPSGYGRINAVLDGKKYRLAHRFSLAVAVGDPGPLDVDHKCGVKRCVNPAHLEAVDPKINRGRYVHWNSRKTTCKLGHPFQDVPGTNRRVCKECRSKKRRAT